MKLRIRNSFKSKRPITLEEKANVLAYNVWQIALAGAKNLHAEDFIYDNDRQRVAVIAECLIFLVHVADRASYAQLDAEQRTTFVSILANDTSRSFQRNTEEVLGKADYKTTFIDMMNQRFAEYSKSRMELTQPGYAMYRQFGAHVRDVMGHDQTNKWAIDQIMDADGPEMINKMMQSLKSILDAPSAEEKAKSSVDLLLED